MIKKLEIRALGENFAKTNLTSTRVPEIRRDAIRAAETGDAVKAQSLEELASALNIPAETLINTIKERNAEITSDKPQSRRFPILKAPFWAARVGMRIHYTMGGLQINEKAQCLKEGKTIPGLYAAGEITGGIHGRNSPNSREIVRY